MPTLIQLSEHTFLNVDAVLLIRVLDGEVQVVGRDQAPPLLLTPEETVVLRHFLTKHVSRLSYTAVRRVQTSGRYEEPAP